jgi:hypothetical protein
VKKLTLVFLSLVLLGFAGMAMASQDKSTVLHCGCAWDGLDATMVYKDISISSKSKGHDAHLVGTVDSCYAGTVEIDVDVFEDVFVDFVRNGDDCQLDGPPLGDPIFGCDGFDPVPVAGDPCGVAVID